VHDHREVHPDRGVEHRGSHGAGGVDDGEHRWRDDRPKARLVRGVGIEMDRVGLADDVRVLPDLLASDLVLERLVALPD
jgi:hypothetical protein